LVKLNLETAGLWLRPLLTAGVKDLHRLFMQPGVHSRRRATAVREVFEVNPRADFSLPDTDILSESPGTDRD
jgi:hypothetical protein